MTGMRQDGDMGTRRGMSLVEVLVALTVFTSALLVLTRTGFVASHALRHGGSYVTEWTIAQSKLDSLSALGWAALDGEEGTETVHGVAVSWEVKGVNPRWIVLVVNRQVGTAVHADTFMTYVADLD